MFEPSEQPHPLLCGIATTPSTLGNFSRVYWVNSAIVAICCDSWLAHMLVGTMSTKLRVPTRPSGRRKPCHVATCEAGKYPGGAMCRSAGRSRTTGTSLLMFRSVIGSPSAMPRDVPIGCPYCSTNVPSGMALVANRWPGVTAPVSVTGRPPGASRVRPASTAVFTTATLSAGSTMTAKSLSAGEADCCCAMASYRKGV